MIVDDYEGNRKLFKRFLHGLPCSIDLAEDGNEAVRKAACVDYDIIFTDGECRAMLPLALRTC